MHGDSGNRNSRAYRWVVLAAAVPIAALVMGQLVNGLAVYFVPLETELGWARADIAMINSMGLAGLALGSILMGFAADRYGVRRIALLGVTVTGVATIAASRAGELWQLYALFLIAGLLGGGSISAPLTALVGSWFTRRVGLAIGIIAAAQALGQGGMPFSGAFLIENFGWRDALAAQGVVTLALGLPLAWLLRAPAAAAPGSPALSHDSPTGLPNGLVVAWIAAGVVFCCTTMSVPLMHLVPLAQENGLAATDAGGVLFLMMVVAIAGRAVFGHVADRIGAIQTWLLTSAWQTLLVFGFTMVHGTSAFYVYAVIYGFGYAGVMTSVLVTTRNLTAPARRAASLGIVLAFGYIGHGIGGWQGGFFYDMTGTYTWSYANAVISGFVNLAVIGSLWWTINRRSRLALA
ncbi:MAG TPA: MFS transporter [Gammaproteobacteria bacterium]|nr:MFS transporter [Gammaproteobacteria bacterium]